VHLLSMFSRTCKWGPTSNLHSSIEYPQLDHSALKAIPCLTLVSYTFKMATRRIVATEKTFLDKDDPIDEHSSTAPAVPR
jgi:hypothetical protein